MSAHPWTIDDQTWFIFGRARGSVYSCAGFLEETAVVASVFDSDRHLDQELQSLMVQPFYQTYSDLKATLEPLMQDV